MLKKLIVLISLIALLWSPTAFAAEDKALTNATTLGEIFGYISNYHLHKPDIDQLTNSAIKGMLDQLGDPYTVYFSPGELDKFSGELNGDFEGIGAELEIREHLPYVVRVFNGSPAEQAGLRSGDIILSIDNNSTQGKTLTQVVEQLRGKKGTKVRIMVKRVGQPDFPLEITRNTIDLPTVTDNILEGQVGYIAIDSFGLETGEEFGNALIKLKEAGIKYLIIDLRYNGGGYVDAALEIAGYLLGKDKIVLLTEDREKYSDSYATELDALIAPLPMVVLVNGQSASAAEILAGALQDYGRATLVGTNTYGKGTVQDILPLGNGGALKMTTAYYLTPKGRRIDGQGLQPDRYIATPELQILAAKQILLQEKPVITFTAEKTISTAGETLSLPVGYHKENDQFFVPLRLTLEALGYEVKWDEQTGNIEVKDKNNTWQLTNHSLVNGSSKLMTQPLRRINGYTYISTEDLQLLGIEVVI